MRSLTIWGLMMPIISAHGLSGLLGSAQRNIRIICHYPCRPLPAVVFFMQYMKPCGNDLEIYQNINKYIKWNLKRLVVIIKFRIIDKQYANIKWREVMAQHLLFHVLGFEESTCMYN